VLDQILGHPWHVRWFPSEDVSVSPEEADERIFLFRVKARRDHGSPKINCLDLHFLGWLRLVGFARLLWDVKFT
jgi:hypothetical protein